MQELVGSMSVDPSPGHSVFGHVRSVFIASPCLVKALTRPRTSVLSMRMVPAPFNDFLWVD